jgi:hypothetical protein
MLRPTYLAMAAGLLAACTGDDSSSPTGPLTAREQLAEGSVFFLDSEASEATMNAEIYVGVTPTVVLAVDIPVTGGVLYAGLDDEDHVVLDEVTVTLGVARMRMELDELEHGILLSDFTLRVHAPAAFTETLWGDDDDIAMATGGTATLGAEWKVTSDFKETVPWPEWTEVEQETALDLDLMVLPGRGEIELLAFGETRPFVWTWGPLMISSELELGIDAFARRE